MEKKLSLRQQKKAAQEEMREISEWLSKNTRDPEFIARASRRAALSVQVEILNQKLNGLWNHNRQFMEEIKIINQ